MSSIFVSGPSNSGKTTLIEKLISRLREEGLRVGTIKHAHHGFEADLPGKDSFRHTQAGANAVTVIAPGEAFFLTKTANEMSLEEAMSRMALYADLILIEGYKEVSGPKILIEPDGQKRIHVEKGLCRVGVRPDQLSSGELERIVSFVVSFLRRPAG